MHHRDHVQAGATLAIDQVFAQGPMAHIMQMFRLIYLITSKEFLPDYISTVV